MQNIQVAWNGHTSQIAIDKDNQNFQFFDSYAAEDLYNGATRYKGVQFHFHHHSEHSVDGKYHDLEMHTVHLGVKDKKGANPGNV